MRSVTTTMQNAIALEHGYKIFTKAEIFPSLIFFESVTRNNVIAGADSRPAGDTPLRQDIVWNSTAGLITFWADSYLKYCIDGDNTIVTTAIATDQKPGVFGNYLFAYVGGNIVKYTINGSAVAALNTNPFSASSVEFAPTNAPVAIHAISNDECVLICDDDGGFRVSYWNTATETISSGRFMFPSIVDWDGSDRTMASMGLFSTAAYLDEKIFVYISNAANGVVDCMYYDPDTDTWSDVFVVVPTDKEVSLCEFRIANSFVRNNTLYLVGQFERSDIFESAYPYTLILASTDGKKFSIDRFTLVSDIGWRFLATVGNNKLFMANCNRVCEAPITWVFDGDDDSTSVKTEITMEDAILSIQDSVETLTLVIAAGNESVLSNTHFAVDSRIKLYVGYVTSAGNESVLYGTYIVKSDETDFANGVRDYQLSCVSESQYKLSGLSMPFYAEILGLSSIFDPMTEQSGKLYTAPSNARTETKFFLDFWNHEEYDNSGSGITGVSVIEDGGVGARQSPGSHKEGIILKDEVKYILNLLENPKITATTVGVKVYGWSYPLSGSANDKVNVVLITCDENGNNEETTITTGTAHWPITYPTSGSGNEPISISITGLTVDTYIKKVGLVFEAANSTYYSPARIEFVSGVLITTSTEYANTPWTSNANGTFSVPTSGQPFIMFSQKPYNAFNFDLSAMFSNNISGGVAGYPVGAGLVGLAEDAQNYILARYDKVADEVQLVACRNGIETELASAAPGWTVDDLNGIRFVHKNGVFTVYMYRESTSKFTQVLQYEWQAADGFMCTSSTITKKCGIYGAIMAPSVRILSYSGNARDTVSLADGIPIDPLDDHSDFPTSGQLSIGNNVYSYTGKISHPAYIPGPHQLRNCGVYPPPFGNGKAGLECRMFDWTESPSAYTGKLIALDNGSNFISAGSLWQVYITTGGAVEWLRNRSRHYSNNSQISRLTGTLATRVFPAVGGFTGVSLRSGNPFKHSVGDYAILKLSGSIKCYWFMGTGGENDTTVRELIETTCRLCGATAKFPGDFYDNLFNVTGEVEVLHDDYAEGFDFQFRIPSPRDFEVRTNIKLKATNYEEKSVIQSDTGTKLVFRHLGSGNYEIDFVTTPTETVLYTYKYTNGDLVQRFRILYHENSITIYHNYTWVVSIATDELLYSRNSYVSLSMYHATGMNISEVYVRDLDDWREAVYIDLETDGESAISSIVQERPIETVNDSDGSIQFFYEYDRTEITNTAPIRYIKRTRSAPSDSGSDAIIYNAVDVKTVHDDNFAKTFGFSTKLMRLPNLSVGAIEATYRLMLRAFQQREKYKVVIRPDVRIQVGDKFTFSGVLSATGLTVSATIIVESVNLTISQVGKSLSSEMTVTGRLA